MEEELNAVLTPEQKKRLKERFFRHAPGGFFRPPEGEPPGGKRGMMHKERGFVLRGDSRDSDFDDDWE